MGVPADIWALGVVLYLMVGGRPPWAGAPLVRLIDQICHAPLPALPKASPALMDLLGLLLEKDPAQRLTVHDICDHPWLADTDARRPFDDRAARFDSLIKDQGIDVALIQELTSQCGIQWQQLKESLMTKRYDANTAIYRMKRRPRAIAIYRESKDLEQIPQAVSFAAAAVPGPQVPGFQPGALQKGILEQGGWRSRLRKDLVRFNSGVQAGPKLVQPALKKA
jgi:serine/threonine protein kinase